MSERTSWGMVALCALTLGIFLAFLKGARAQEEALLVFCDSPTQVETFLNFKGETAIAVEWINTETPNACAFRPIRFYYGDEVMQVQVEERLYSIIKVAVVGSFNKRWRMGEPVVQYIAVTIKNPLLIKVQHQHPPQDEALHEKFYSTWYMPDQPTKSCCNKADCYPTEVTYRNGNIYALRREDQKWLRIPSQKVEMNRDNPDGRNHLCAPPPNSSHPPDTVFCFSLGGGI